MDLRETKDLYGRLMILARSSRDINQKEAIGNLHLLAKLTPAETPHEDQQPEEGWTPHQMLQVAR